MYELYPYWSGYTALASLATRCLAAEIEKATSSQELPRGHSRTRNKRAYAASKLKFHTAMSFASMSSSSPTSVDWDVILQPSRRRMSKWLPGLQKAKAEKPKRGDPSSSQHCQFFFLSL